MRLDRNQPLSLRGLNKSFGEVGQLKKLTSAGIDLESSVGNPLSTTPPLRDRFITARITGIAYRSDGTTPLLTSTGALQYTWIEELRSNSPDQSPTWTDATDAVRKSVMLAPGSYLNLAHEANDGQATVDHVILWASVNTIQYSGQSDHEHIFYQNDYGFAVATSDWVMGTWRTATKASPGTDDYVECYRCADMDGDNIYTTPAETFKVYFYKRAGLRDPAIFGPYTNYYGDQAGDVIKYAFDYELQQYYCISEAYDDALGSIKYGRFDIDKIRQGWHICDGTTPTGTKIGALDDTRGLFTRATDKPPTDSLWSDGKTGGTQASYQGAADNTGADGGTGSWGIGGRTGVSSSRKDVSQLGGAPNATQNLLDVSSWSQATADGDPNPLNTVVVCPPTWVYCQIIRYK